jgi:hypothetical protein
VKARRAAAGLVGAALVLTLAGCPNEPAPPTAKTVPTPASVTEAIKSLCDFFVARAHETLRKPEAEGNVELFRGTPGFPADLNDYARAYYLTNASDPFDAGERAKLDAAYAKVIKSCESHGWKA